MPLKSGYSEATVHHNIGQLVKDSYPRNQASAIALELGRESYFKRHPQGFLPPYLKLPNGRRDRASWDKYRRRPRGKNPVPPSSGSMSRQIESAEKLYRNFTGHEADEQITVDMPPMPDVVSVIGDIDGIMYTTVRDGEVEKYIHKFKKNCRPLFCVSPDGKQIFMLGGSYDFTERGIVDRSKS